MRKLDFLIFYEVKNREFESIVLLRNELVKRGYSVDFFSFFELNDRKRRKKFFNNVRVAIMPSLYHQEEVLKIVYSVAGKVDNIVNLRWEQVFTNKTEVEMEYYVYPKGIAQEGYHCCWGKRPMDMLKRAGVNGNRIAITGPIHMDFLRPEFKEYYLSKKDLYNKYNIACDKECILFISSFSMSTLNENELEYFLLDHEEPEKENIRQFILKEKKSHKLIIEWLIKLAEMKDCTIIYRPHPVEYNTKEVEVLFRIPNIKVISEENIKQWILRCDQVYSWYSTSFAEAFVAGIPCAILRPEAIDYDDDLPIYKDLEYIQTFEDFCKYYEEMSSYEDDLSKNQGIIADYYDIQDKKMSYVRTSDFLEKILNEQNRFPWNSIATSDYIKIRYYYIKQDLKKMISGFIEKNSKSYLAKKL